MESAFVAAVEGPNKDTKDPLITPGKVTRKAIGVHIVSGGY